MTKNNQDKTAKSSPASQPGDPSSADDVISEILEQISDESKESGVENSSDNANKTSAGRQKSKKTNPASLRNRLQGIADTIQANQTQISELVNDLQRTRADFENFRKQADLQKSQARAAATLATVEKFLPLVDDFSRAISAYPEQLAPLSKNLDKLLKNLSLQMINSDPGIEFNPDCHEAVSVDDADGDTEVIAETLRPGYLYNKSVLRPAMVKVTRK